MELRKREKLNNMVLILKLSYRNVKTVANRKKKYGYLRY